MAGMAWHISTGNDGSAGDIGNKKGGFIIAINQTHAS